jgi:tape measure domain-containing protein
VTDIAKLGFEIDTSGLQQAKTAADQAAQSIGKVGTAADTASGKVSGVGKAAEGSAAGADRLQKAVGGLSGVLSGVAREAGSLATVLGIAGQSQGGAVLGAALASVSRLLPAVTGGLMGTVPILGTAAAGVTSLATGYVGLISALAPLEDRFKQYEAQIRVALRSETLAVLAFQDIKRSANEAGISIDSAVGAFTRIARNAEQLGATTPEVLQLTETIQKLGVISGASQGEVGSGMLQLSQALAAGRLNGDELRSILENMPSLARAIADGLGVSVGELRRLGAEGQLTSDKVFKAILGQTDKVRKDFESLPDTTERAFQRMTNQAQEFGAKLGESLNASGMVQSILSFAAGQLQNLNSMLDNSAQGRLARLQAENERDRLLADQTGVLGAFNTLGSNVLARGRIEERNREIESIREEQRLAGRLTAQARLAEQDRASNAPVLRGLQVAKEVDSIAEKQAKLKAQTDTLNEALARLDERFAKGAVPQADYAEQRDKLTRSLAAVRVEALQAGSAFDKLNQTLADERAARALGGGGGGLALARRAIAASRQATQQGRPVGAGDALQPLIAEQVMGVGTDIENLRRQEASQESLRAKIGATAETIRELEVAQAVADFRFQKFGSITTPAVEAAMKAYEAQLRATKAAQDEVTSAGTIDGLERNLRRLEAQRGAVGDPARRRELELNARIEDATRNLPAGTAGTVGDLMRREDAAQRGLGMAEQTEQLKRQIEITKQQYQLLGLSTEEYAVQQAVLSKMNDLIAQGVDLRSVEARQQMELTAELARQQNALQKQQETFAEFKRIGEDVGRGIRTGISESFVRAFQTGKLEARSFLDVMNNVLNQILSNLINAALKPVTAPLEMFVSNFTNSLIGGGLGAPAGGGAGGGGSFTAPSVIAARGYAFRGGNVVPFARGGVVGGPTYFPMSGGRTGLMGEAGPEAVMPLSRTADGKLGVASSGAPGVQIVVNDMRQSPGSEPVEIKEERGDDGRRVISVLVRDEVRRAMRSGDLDRDFSSNYGTRRLLAKR